jgi:hypothetical protein
MFPQKTLSLGKVRPKRRVWGNIVLEKSHSGDRAFMQI